MKQQNLFNPVLKTLKQKDSKSHSYRLKMGAAFTGDNMGQLWVYYVHWLLMAFHNSLRALLFSATCKL